MNGKFTKFLLFLQLQLFELAAQIYLSKMGGHTDMQKNG